MKYEKTTDFCTCDVIVAIVSCGSAKGDCGYDIDSDVDDAGTWQCFILCISSIR